MHGIARTVLLVAAVLAGPAATGAQIVRGVVVEAETRTPVRDAVVELLGVDAHALASDRTDSAGVFMVTAPQGGAFIVRARHPAFVASAGDSVRVAAGEMIRVELRLGRTVIPLDPLIVTARSSGPLAGFEERRRASSFGRFLTRAQIDARGAGRTTDLLRGMPGVTLAPVRGRSTRVLVRMHSGLGVCSPSVWIDGVQVSQLPESTLDDMLSPGAIEAVEVYNSVSSVPPQFVSGVCGAMMFWTRRGDETEGEPWRWKRVLAGAGAALVLFLLIR
jgi:TonB-dependent Receptor Plug Domain/Carboxypeptidase regulatory-like domain